MQAPIVVNYIPDGDDWTITVTQDQQVRTGRAAGLIAARDRADQLVEQLAPEATSRRVVHLLDGDAYAFTTSYLEARLGLSADSGEARPLAAPPASVAAAPPVEPPAAVRPTAPIVPRVPVTKPVTAKEPAKTPPGVDVQTGTLPLQAG